MWVMTSKSIRVGGYDRDMCYEVKIPAYRKMYGLLRSMSYTPYGLLQS